ncbi:MAG: cellulase family glycosylhydrolase, partial [Asticcacaulis sp.]
MKPSIAAAVAALLFAPVASHADGFLHARDKDIVDGSGRPVILRGMGLGGWMLQEGYMLEAGGLPQHVMRQKISELIGPQKTQAFYTAWLDNDITKADIDAMAGWGF